MANFSGKEPSECQRRAKRETVIMYVVANSQEDNWESSSMEESDNDLEIYDDGEVSEIVDFGSEVETDVKKAYCSPIQQFN